MRKPHVRAFLLQPSTSRDPGKDACTSQNARLRVETGRFLELEVEGSGLEAEWWARAGPPRPAEPCRGRPPRRGRGCARRGRRRPSRRVGQHARGGHPLRLQARVVPKKSCRAGTHVERQAALARRRPSCTRRRRASGPRRASATACSAFGSVSRPPEQGGWPSARAARRIGRDSAHQRAVGADRYALAGDARPRPTVTVRSTSMRSPCGKSLRVRSEATELKPRRVSSRSARRTWSVVMRSAGAASAPRGPRRPRWRRRR